LPTDWVDRDDRVAGPCPAGPVRDDEQVARLLNTTTWQGGELRAAAFPKDELRPPKKAATNNMCGARNGESLLRCSDMTSEELTARAIQQSAERSEGAVVATVAAIRAIKLPHDDAVQLFRIYEDPTVIDWGHAVIRFDPNYRANWVWAKEELMRAFSKI
jgi:hypothetical protein